MSRSASHRPGQGKPDVEVRDVRIPPVGLAGTMRTPRGAHAVVAFAHGSGSSRLSPRNMAVAEGLNAQGFATLLFDLLTSDEEADRANVFDITLLAERLVTPSIGLIAIPEPAAKHSGYSGQAPAPRRLSSPPQGLTIGSAPSSRAAGARILPATCWTGFARRPS